ncbi:MAG: hypothetical protein ACI3YB_05235 [Prevotella sp.]
MKRLNISSWSADKISRIVLYAIVGAIAVVFGLFYTVGYDSPYYENPDFNAPELSGMLIWFVLIFIVLAFVLTIVTVCVVYRRCGCSQSIINGVNRSRILLSVNMLLIVLLLLTFLCASSAPLIINGESFDDVLSLKTADMFVSTSFIMIVLSISAIVFDTVRNQRNRR